MNELPVSDNSDNNLENIDYLRGVKSSTCLLMPATPSPTPLDFQHPLSDQMNEGPLLLLNGDADHMQTIDSLNGDSSSSGDSNSVIQDPVSAQLINNISMLDYQTLNTKNGDIITSQTEDGKLNGSLNFGNKKLPSFVNWNWHIIRKVLLWVVVSGLIACLATIIAIVITIPKVCNPDIPWHQGKVFYEVFPASFKDSNNDGTGDLKGLIKKLNYIEDLGASAIRLNYIFESKNYPESYENVTSLFKIDSSVGTMNDFQLLVAAVHSKNMSLVLDIPTISMVTLGHNANVSHSVILSNNTVINTSTDEMSAALAFWAKTHHVDGFYLKGLEKFVNDPNFGLSLQRWKQIIGSDKILIASEETYLNAKSDALHILLSRVDLIDVHLNLKGGPEALKKHINDIVSGTLWSKPYYSWVLWNVGSIGTERLSARHYNNTLTLNALQLVLPGTVNIFYGDEIRLGGLENKEIEEDFHEYKQVHNIVSMRFNKEHPPSGSVLPWNSKSKLEPDFHYVDIIRSFIEARLSNPTIYLRAIFKDGNVLRNMAIRETESNLVVMERWYPRRNTCVFVGNLGSESVTTDLSTMFYGGTVVASTNTSLVGQVLYFDSITFPPNSAVILKLEK